MSGPNPKWRLVLPKGPIARRRLEGDWLAVDVAGRVGLFAGGDSGPIPRGADPDATAAALAAMDAAAEARLAARGPAAYRAAGERPVDPIFDVPVGPGGAALHEEPYEGYPHLVFTADPTELRRLAIDVPSREAPVRDGFAFVFPALGALVHDWLHDGSVCFGCRALDPPDDPRPRAPELVAANGIYAFVHPGGEDGSYHRFASPSVPLGLERLEPIVARVAALVTLPVAFDETARVLEITFPR